MNDSEALVNEVCELLKKVRKWKWRNNAALAKELKVDEQILLKTLIEEVKKPKRRIQYHPLPSGKKMDILWGLADENEDISVPSLVREDDPELQIQNPLNAGEPFIFLSHNYRDFNPVNNIRGILQQNGLNCWLFQSGIEFNQLIIPKVKEALRLCIGLIVFVSKHSLGSLWVQKEFGFVLKELEKPAMVIVDGTDEKLTDWIKNINDPQGYDMFSNYVENCLIEGNIKVQDQWRRIAQEFGYQIQDHIHYNGMVITYPDDSPEFDSKLKLNSTIKDWKENFM